jgi:hypothetical protein
MTGMTAAVTLNVTLDVPSVFVAVTVIFVAVKLLSLATAMTY